VNERSINRFLCGLFFHHVWIETKRRGHHARQSCMICGDETMDFATNNPSRLFRFLYKIKCKLDTIDARTMA
jgi:hypothetical protein